MAKRSDIYNNVVQELRKTPSTILQVSKAVNTNWETVKYAIETLEKIKLVTSYEENGKTYYTLNEAEFLQLQNDTLLGLPITDDQRKATLSLAKRIQEKWKKLYPERQLNKTFMQKILVKLVQRYNIPNIPYGWYLFGQCAVLYFIDTELIPANTKYDTEIEEVLKEHKDIPTTKDLLQRHYLEEGNELYLTRFKINELLSYKLDKENVDLLKRNLKQFIFSFLKNENNVRIIEEVNGFYSLCLRLINSHNENELEDIRNMIYDAFSNLWELMATYNLYESLKRGGWYEDSVLRRYYLLRVEILIPTVEEYLTILQDHCPPITVPADEPLRKKL